MDTSSSSTSSSSSSSTNANRNKRRRGQTAVDPVGALISAEDASILTGSLVNDYLELVAADPVSTALYYLGVAGTLSQ